MRNALKRIEREVNFMSIYRCAVCGSSRVVPETKQEGYNKKQGILGMAVFGLGGAVAGASGNTVVYYHCADCGHTLNRCMSDFEKNSIDRYLLNPDNEANKTMLRIEKKQYPNIEWEESTIEKNDSAEIPIQDNQPLTDEEYKKRLEEIQQMREKYAQKRKFQQPQIPVAEAILNALYKAEKPCTISEMQNIDEACKEYSNQELSSIARQLIDKKIIEKIVENHKAYFKAIPDSKDEAVKML